MTGQHIPFAKIAGDDGYADVIFVHGLTGNPVTTWISMGATEPEGDYWPSWLATDLPYVNIYTLGYLPSDTQARASVHKFSSPPILYYKMAGIQNEALHNLTGRGLCDVKLVDRGRYWLSAEGRRLAGDVGAHLVLEREEALLEFLTKKFSAVGTGKGGLRAATGLRRVGT